MAGKVYFAAALLLGIAFLYFGVQICREYSYPRARGLLLASVIYIPLLFGFLVFDNVKFPLSKVFEANTAAGAPYSRR
jgi:protoheme IX farnesyltransferase